MPYPSVPDQVVPEEQRQPVGPPVSFKAFRKAYTHDAVHCTKCQAECETFADGISAEGVEIGWLPICEKCFEPFKPAPPAPDPAPQPTV